VDNRLILEDFFFFAILFAYATLMVKNFSVDMEVFNNVKTIFLMSQNSALKLPVKTIFASFHACINTYCLFLK
jgi:hypothetical protein